MIGIISPFLNYTGQWLTRCIIVLAAFTCIQAGAQTLLWEEDFNTGSVPDSSIWTYETGAGGWGNQEYQNYTSNTNNVKVEGGNLIITAKKTSATAFTSGRIITQDKLTFKYGTVEARIKTPNLANGLWPALWTLGNNYPPWPQCGEIDIMEMGSASAISAGVVNRQVISTAHWGSIDQNGNHPNYGLPKNYATDIDDTFVIYKMEWTPSSITTYINNQQIWSMGISSFQEFQKPHFLILNMAVGGTFTGITGASNKGQITALPNTGDTADYVIDYIRIYDNGHTVLGGTGAPNFPPEFIEDPIIRTNAFEGIVYSTFGDFEGRTLEGTATDVEGDTLSYSKVSGPDWLQVFAGGRLAGTPGASDIGLNSWTVQVSDGNGGTDTATLEITVDKANDDPVFTVDPIVTTNAVEGIAYSTFGDFAGRTLADWATDVDPGDTLEFSKLSGPAWLTVYTAGRLGGTPGASDIGLNSWIVQVDDGNGGTDTTTLEITIDSASPPPALSIQVSGSNLEILWPSPSTGYSLYGSTNLSPSIVWSSVTNTPIIQGADWMVTIPIAEAPQFFRLENP